MKDHFHKTIMPRIHTFGLSASDLRKFQSGAGILAGREEDEEEEAIIATTSDESFVSAVITPTKHQPQKQGDGNEESGSSETDDEFDAALLQKAQHQTRQTRSSSNNTSNNNEKNDYQSEKSGIKRFLRKSGGKSSQESDEDVRVSPRKKLRSESPSKTERQTRSKGLLNGDARDKGKGIPNKPHLVKNVSANDGSGDNAVDEQTSEHPVRSKYFSPKTREGNVSLNTAKQRIMQNDCDEEDLGHSSKDVGGIRNFVMMDTQESQSQAEAEIGKNVEKI